jgi:integrase
LALAITQVRERRHEDLTYFRIYVNNTFPDTIKALQIIDNENIQPKRRKGFNLLTIGNKYYARLSHNGKTLPTKFNCNTENEREAELYVLKNKERLIEGYLSRKNGKMYKTLESFYESEQDKLSERCRKEYGAVIKYKFVPFLKQEKIRGFEQITKNILMKFQDALLTAGIQPQSVNNNMKAVRRLFEKLVRRNEIEDNPCDFVKGLTVSEENKRARGCYDLEKVKGVFSRKWKDELSYLLCSLIYTTGMRNSEIKRIRLEDVQVIDGRRFIRIEKSKTANGVRLVPLHKALYEKIKICALKNKKEREPLFDYNYVHFNRANNELARKLKVSDEELERENITFYSGRHFWKTLMSAEGLGEDIEEIFMGHKVTSNTAKLYNHRDKQGRSRMIKKAEQVFSILDRCVFNGKPKASSGRIFHSRRGGN